MEGGGSGATSTGGGSGTGGVSASLTPAIWEKTIPYDGENFHLEYMDLDEFLLENGIPVALEEEEQLQKSFPSVAGKGKSIPKVTASAAAAANTTTAAATTTTTTTTTPPSAAAASVSASASSPSEPAASVEGSHPEETVTVTTLQPAKLEDDDEEEEEEEGQEEDSLLEASREEMEVKEKQTGKRCYSKWFQISNGGQTHYPDMPKLPWN